MSTNHRETKNNDTNNQLQKAVVPHLLTDKINTTTVTPKVLVVGAGPAGLTLACELWRRGVPCRLVDQQLYRHDESRATDVQSRTLEVFQAMGVLDEFLTQGVKVHGFNLYSTGRLLAHLPYNDLDIPFNFVIGISQSNTERILEARLEQLGGTVERGVSLASLEQDEYGVNVVLMHADGQPEEQRFDWAIGCDGAHSAVRRSLGLTLAGSTFAEHFFLADVELDWDVADDQKSLFVSEHGMLAVLPIPGMMRVFGDLDFNDEPEINQDWLSTLLQARTYRQPEIGKIGWTSRFRVHSRIVDRYRVGRVFLAGDAAHIHSPVGGQGMNTSIQDAYNLAWKLVGVCRGAANPELLDSYETERRPIARAVLWDTDFQTRVATWRNARGQDTLMELVRLGTKLPFVRRRFIASELEVAVHYRHSPVVAEHRGSKLGRPLFHNPDEVASLFDMHRFAVAPQPGDRAPDVLLSDGKTLFELLSTTMSHVLLLFDGTSTTVAGYDNLIGIAKEVRFRWSAQIRVLNVVLAATAQSPETEPGSVLLDPEGLLHHRYGATAECLYLIRPDGYIGFRSGHADQNALLDYLNNIFTLLTPIAQNLDKYTTLI